MKSATDTKMVSFKNEFNSHDIITDVKPSIFQHLYMYIEHCYVPVENDKYNVLQIRRPFC